MFEFKKQKQTEFKGIKKKEVIIKNEINDKNKFIYSNANYHFLFKYVLFSFFS